MDDSEHGHDRLLDMPDTGLTGIAAVLAFPFDPGATTHI